MVEVDKDPFVDMLLGSGLGYQNDNLKFEHVTQDLLEDPRS